MKWLFVQVAVLCSWFTTAWADDILTATGFIQCPSTGVFTASSFSLSYDKTTNILTFGLIGASTKAEKIHGYLTISAYGFNFNKDFNPCDLGISQLCPLPATPVFIPNISLSMPPEVKQQIPDIAFQLPDLDAIAKLVLINDANDVVGCFEAVINNGKTTMLNYVSWISAGLAGLAITASVISTVTSSASSSMFVAHTPSPTVFDMFGFFQNIVYTGQLSVSYPAFYLHFTQNFAWSTGVISWKSLQDSITSTRLKTGGAEPSSNIISSSSTLASSTDTNTASNMVRRDTTSGLLSSLGNSKSVNGLSNWATTIGIPPGNLFMTALVIFLFVVAALLVILVILRGVLELFYISNPTSKRVISIRRNFHYFFMANCLRLILLAFGSLATYAFFEFTLHDSWLVSLISGIALVVFGLILVFLNARIFYVALRNPEGHVALYKNGHYRKRYGFFYNRFKSDAFYFFAPLIVYELVKAAFLGLAQGHDYVQTIGLTVVELILLMLLIFILPHYDKTSRAVSIVISIVRLISYGILIAFVEELNIQPTPKAGLGLALLIIQIVMVALLAILVIVNLFLALRKNSLRRYEERDPKRIMADSSDDEEVNDKATTPVGRLKRNVPMGSNSQRDSESILHSPTLSTKYSIPPLQSQEVEAAARHASMAYDDYRRLSTTSPTGGRSVPWNDDTIHERSTTPIMPPPMGPSSDRPRNPRQSVMSSGQLSVPWNYDNERSSTSSMPSPSIYSDHTANSRR